MATVLISGGTGLVGRHLCSLLKEKGYEVALLSRSKKHSISYTTYLWDTDKKEIDPKAIETADYIIHLAGENIGAKRWTTERKKQITESRVQSAQLLFETVKRQNKKLKAFVSASACGYYGALTSDKIFTEADPPASDFLGTVCKQWEAAADQFAEQGIRTVKLRTGIVLTEKEGALAKMMMPVKMGIGSAIGNGAQYIPWIHIEDLCNIYLKAIEDNRMQGAYNAAAPQHQTNKTFTETLARVLQKPFWFPKIPALMMKLLFGEMSVLLLKGSRVSSEKIINAGYHFLFPELESALKDLLRK